MSITTSPGNDHYEGRVMINRYSGRISGLAGLMDSREGSDAAVGIGRYGDSPRSGDGRTS